MARGSKAFDHSKYKLWIDPNELVPYEKNAKVHTDKQIKNIVNSINRFGWQQDVVITTDNVLVIGHGRRLAAIKIGCEVPYHVIDKTADELTDKDIRELRIADNKTNSETGYDFDIMEAEIGDLEFEGFDFDFDEIGGVATDTPTVVEDDYEPELPEEPKAKLGDIYQLGKHRLMCGDSTDPETVAKLMDGVKADLLLTDPPYGINVVRGGDNRNRQLAAWGGWPASLQEQSAEPHRFTSGRVGGGSMNTPRKNRISPEAVVPAKTYNAIIGDETTETAQKNYEIAKEVTDNQIIFGGNYFTDFLKPSRCWVVWDKENTGNFADAELAWTSFDKGVKLYHHMWNGLAREGDRKTEGITRVHPTQKPVELLEELIQKHSNPNDTILDCFAGSASTAIAAYKQNRNFIGCEISKEYYDKAMNRIQTQTKPPTL